MISSELFVYLAKKKRRIEKKITNLVNVSKILASTKVERRNNVTCFCVTYRKDMTRGWLSTGWEVNELGHWETCRDEMGKGEIGLSGKITYQEGK